mmetsp:Transcript_24040/g.69276  ORF Transcript_24040/g.69276 Transcript_24040/m.69276 type:complete len:404 (+) Transcript_24040:191-1402(+)
MRYQNPQFCLPSIQPFKLSYAQLLCDMGQYEQAAKYVAFTQAFARTVPASHFSEGFRTYLRELEMRIKESGGAKKGRGALAGLSVKATGEVGQALSSLWGGIKGIASTFTGKTEGGGEHPSYPSSQASASPLPYQPSSPPPVPLPSSAGSTMQPPSVQQAGLLRDAMSSPPPAGGSGSRGGGMSVGRVMSSPPSTQPTMGNGQQQQQTLLGDVWGSIKKALQPEERQIGVENTFYYDEVKKRWVDRSRPEESEPEAADKAPPAPPPPPPTGMGMAGPSGVGNPLLKQSGAGGNVRSRYVDVLAPAALATKPTDVPAPVQPPALSSLPAGFVTPPPTRMNQPPLAASPLATQHPHPSTQHTPPPSQQQQQQQHHPGASTAPPGSLGGQSKPPGSFPGVKTSPFG